MAAGSTNFGGMKPLLVPLAFSLSAILSFAAEPVVADVPGKGLVPAQRMLHIGIVVRDIEKAMRHWTTFLGLDAPPPVIMATGDPANPTEFRGQPSAAIAKLAFFQLDNTQVELIEPVGDHPSHWREFLEQHGEGVHHIGFAVTGMGEGHLENFAQHGLPVAQHGGWDGGEYGYMDTHDALGVTVELLESYSDK